MQIASVRRSLFNNAERAKFLSHLVDGVKRILENPQVSVLDAVSGILCFLCIKFLHQKYFLMHIPAVALGEGCNSLLLFSFLYCSTINPCPFLLLFLNSSPFFPPLRVCQTQITTMSSADCWHDWKAITSWESWWRWRTTPRSSGSSPTSPWPAYRYTILCPQRVFIPPAVS